MLPHLVLWALNSLRVGGRSGVGNAPIAPPVPNEENRGTSIVAQANSWLQQSNAQQLADFVNAAEILETIGNLLESSGISTRTLDALLLQRCL